LCNPCMPMDPFEIDPGRRHRFIHHLPESLRQCRSCDGPRCLAFCVQVSH
jgi:hypothetical protein